MPPEEQSSSDDALTEEEERLLALDRACDPWLSELTEMPRSPPPLAGSAALSTNLIRNKEILLTRKNAKAQAHAAAQLQVSSSCRRYPTLLERQLSTAGS